VQYAVRHSLRVGKLALITPSGRAVGLEVAAERRREIVDLRRAEPWFAAAAAVFERGAETDDDWEAIAPLYYGRWNAAARCRPLPMAR
jgi:proline iminopeptidase